MFDYVKNATSEFRRPAELLANALHVVDGLVVALLVLLGVQA
jgi:hypothetical protein